jgi:uncharacterized protein (DUF983 family)
MTQSADADTTHFTAGPRPVARAMWLGALGKCPHCGEGKLFNRYLKVTPACEVCGEEYSHHRADDAPPYFTMMLSGHILVPIMLWVQMAYDLPLWVHLTVWLPLIGIGTVAMLQPVKGAIVAFQWALRMHGFDGNPDPGRFDAVVAPAMDKAAPPAGRSS